MGHEILIEIVGGIALLLWATRMVRTGVLRAFGSELRHGLGKALAHRGRAFAVGLGVTVALQSSTATALLILSFAQQGLLKASTGLIVLLGADVGSTIAVQILSFDLRLLSPLLIFAGVVAFMGWDRPVAKHLGRTAVGLGLLLLSLRLIVAASGPLRESAGLASVLSGLAADPLLALLLGALLTWLAHSSVAIILVVISLALSGVVPLPLALALVLGANVGGALVAVVLTLRMPAAVRRPPLANFFCRLALALAALPFLGAAGGLLGQLDSDPARLVANYHTAFNLLLALVFLPLAGIIGRLSEKLLPAGEEEGSGVVQPKHLDEGVIDRPAVALAAATREVMRLADLTETMLRRTIEAFEAKDSREIALLSRMDDDIDSLQEAIKLYLTRLSRQPLSEAESERCIEIIQFTTNLEHIGDIIDKNLLELAQKKLRHKLTFSEDGWGEIRSFHAKVLEQMQSAMAVFVSGDVGLARQMIAEKERFRDLALDSADSHLARLRSGQIESIETSTLHLDILRDLKRINSHLVSVAYPILDAQGELRKSRLKVPPDVQRESAAVTARGVLPKAT